MNAFPFSFQYVAVQQKVSLALSDGRSVRCEVSNTLSIFKISWSERCLIISYIDVKIADEILPVLHTLKF